MKPLQSYRACIVCGGVRISELADLREMEIESEFRERLFHDLYSDDTREYMLKDRAYPTQDYAARLMVCDQCGTVARDPQLSAQDTLEEYATDVYHPRWLESSYREFHSSFFERMPELVAWVGEGARVLEIGSFVEGFLAAARDYGWSGHGVDVGKCVVDFARSHGLDVRKGTLSGAAFPAHSFDAVFVWYYFDQLPEPWRDLEEIHRILKPGGRLLVRVPNGDFVKLLHGIRRIAPAEFVRDGVRKVLSLAGLASFPFQVGYTPVSLAEMLRASGFDSIDVRNQINLRGGDPARTSFWNLPEQEKTLGRVHALSQLVHHVSLGQVSCGPWIEVWCSKEGASAVSGEVRVVGDQVRLAEA